MTACFPETDTYLVNYMPGTSGEFIAGMISLYVGLRNDGLSIAECGHAHNNSNFNKTFESGFIPTALNMPSDFFHYAPINENRPLVMTSHHVPDYNKLVIRFPKLKHIVITCCEKMWPRAVSNHFFKRVYESFKHPDTVDHYVNFWEHAKTQYEYLRPFKTPQKVPKWLLPKYIMEESLIKTPLWTSGLFHEKTISKNAHGIKFYDIIHSPDSVMNKLSIITGQPITNVIKTSYQSYLAKQEELVANTMPWINDK